MVEKHFGATSFCQLAISSTNRNIFNGEKGKCKWGEYGVRAKVKIKVRLDF
jgi:hypothetical protein